MARLLLSDEDFERIADKLEQMLDDEGVEWDVEWE